MKKILIFVAMSFLTTSGAFAVSSVSGMVDYHFAAKSTKDSKQNINQNLDKETQVKDANISSQNEDPQDDYYDNDYDYASDADTVEYDTLSNVTKVGSQYAKFSDCLEMKKFGQGTWETYCQPIKKPENCSKEEWDRLASMALLNC